MLMSLKLSQSVPVPERLTWVKLSKNVFLFFVGGILKKKWGLITRWKKMEEICIRGKVGTQNQERNSKVVVSRVCGLKFVLDVEEEGGKGSLDVYSFYFLFSCRFPLLWAFPGFWACVFTSFCHCVRPMNKRGRRENRKEAEITGLQKALLHTQPRH